MKYIIIGTILCVAVQGVMILSFDHFDKNGDGKMTHKEYQITKKELLRIEAELGTSDYNKSKVSTFRELDRNGDSVVDRGEFQRFKKRYFQEVSSTTHTK